MYRALDATLVRVAAHAGQVDLPVWPEPTGGNGELASWQAWLARVWSNTPVVEAITVASPVLAAQVARVVDRGDGGNDPKWVRRLVMSVARYLLRMTGRSTPFGLFAGVAATRFGDQPLVRWGRPRANPQADAAWLSSAVTRLETCPPLVRRLPVMANDRSVVRGHRLVLPFQAPSGPAGAGQSALHDVNVRYTPAVAAALGHAHSPIELSTLVNKLAAEFPQTRPDVIQAMLVTLVEQGLLLTSLRPPTTVADALEHVVAQLRAAQAQTVEEVAGLAGELYAIADTLKASPRSPGSRRWSAYRTALVERMRAVDRVVEQPVMVDLSAGLDLTLPGTLRKQVAVAAAVLIRLSPFRDGLPAWQEYHRVFLERYGPGAIVPLLELVSADTGLGLPATYRGSTRMVGEAPLSERDRRLLVMAHKATITGSGEINLDDPTVAALVGEDTAGQAPPPHVELFVQIHAASHEALRRGDYTLAVTGAGRSAGASTGRFLHLLNEPDLARFRAAYTSLPTVRAGAQPVQLSCPPLGDRVGNVARAPQVLDQIVSVGEHYPPAAHILRPSDLAVGGDTAGLYLVSLRDRRLVEPTALNAVELRHYSQPLARFVCELPRARAAVPTPFSWGAAGSLACLPRIRYGSTILAPARWNLSAADLPGTTASWTRWREALADWRGRFRMPARVHLVGGDHLLPLDLEQQLPLALLRAHLDRHGHTRLDAAPPADAFGWLDGHAHEIVIPLAATRAPAPAPPHPDPVVALRGDAQVPGDTPWLYAKLYSHPDRHTELLTDLATELAGWEPPVWWWYVPYRDSGDHLRVRIRLPSSAEYGVGVQQLGAWATEAHRKGLIGAVALDTYHPETGRYGPGAAMAAAERVFATDSTAALTHRRLATHAGADADPDAVAVASLVDLVIAHTGDTEAGMRWLAQLPREHAPVDRTRHAAATRLADPDDNWAALRSLPGGEALLADWQRRRAALAAYRQALTPHRDPDEVLPSLLHMHHIRAFGAVPDRERANHRLARAAAHRWIHTTTTTTIRGAA